MTTEKEEAAPTGIEAAHFKEANQKTKPSDYITKDADQLADMALAVASGGELYAFLPERPEWYRLVGANVHGHLAAKRALIKTDPTPARHGLHPRDLERLKFVHRLASARRRGAQIGPAYAGPTQGSVEEARAALSAAFDQILSDTLAYHAATIRLAA
jgi:hypothetical protein